MIDRDEKNKYSELILNRPPKTELPKILGQAGIISAKFNLDFGSFRDIHRHRALIQRMPLLTIDIGFNNWYLSSLPEGEQRKTEDYLGNLERRIDNLGISPEKAQYFVPMGYNTSNHITGDIPAMVYMAELRSTRFVHPTLRVVARDIGEYIDSALGVPVHFDPEPDRFDIRRGEQDIVVR